MFFIFIINNVFKNMKIKNFNITMVKIITLDNMNNIKTDKIIKIVNKKYIIEIKCSELKKISGYKLLCTK